MKKVFLSAIFSLMLMGASAAFASSVTDSVQAAINAGHFDQINTIAAGNPTAQGEIAMYLLQMAQSKLASNPDLASKIFAAAEPFVSEIPADKAASAADMIKSIVASASDKNFQTGNPCAASTIFASALNMTSQANIMASNSGLHASTLASADTFLGGDKQCQTGGTQKKLQDIVSLAQTPGTPPSITPAGAIVPSGE